jgi:hypothetical protein
MRRRLGLSRRIECRSCEVTCFVSDFFGQISAEPTVLVILSLCAIQRSRLSSRPVCAYQVGVQGAVLCN